MEEVDKIIIDSLKHIKCDIDDDITSLKLFEPNLVLKAIAMCLEIINPEVKLPKTLPVSMSAKIKTASNAAHQIRDLGFKGDMGYQTILYSNEIEVRRVLMFLIERLPKEISPVSMIQSVGLVPKTIKAIQTNLKISMNSFWLPAALLYNGTRTFPDAVIVNSFGSSSPIDSTNLILPSAETSEYIPEVTKQCMSSQLIPSLLFKSADFTQCSNWKKQIYNGLLPKMVSTEILLNKANIKTEGNDNKDFVEENRQMVTNPMQVSLEKLQQKNSYFMELEKSLKNMQEILEKTKKQNLEEENVLSESNTKLKILNTTLAVLHSDENKIKLKNSIQKAENRLVDLSNQWNEVQTPLLEEHKSLKSSISSESLKYQSEGDKYKSLRKNQKDLLRDLKEKSILEQNLIEKCKELNNKNNRAAYTKRILEIVGNIKKQNIEIQKILSDTREVQKDINNLTGQVDRSFILSDELIFYDCKQDETARKAYKFLAALRDECNGILQAVSEMGQAERELRNVEEQVETERNKEVKNKLEKVQKDLDEILKEIKLLI